MYDLRYPKAKHDKTPSAAVVRYWGHVSGAFFPGGFDISRDMSTLAAGESNLQYN